MPTGRSRPDRDARARRGRRCDGARADAPGSAVPGGPLARPRSLARRGARVLGVRPLTLAPARPALGRHRPPLVELVPAGPVLVDELQLLDEQRQLPALVRCDERDARPRPAGTPG